MNILRLCDEAAGTSAEILPERGFNCFRFTARVAERPVEVLWSEAGFAAGTARASGSGIPLLFPFPGRIRQGRFHYHGRDYQLPAGDGRGNAIHGFVLDRPWRVIEQTARRATAEFHAAQVDAGLRELWPTDFLLRVSYELSGNRLASEIEVVNPGDDVLPWGFGTHPYFRVPLAGSAAESCRVTVPASSCWELAELLPTGRQLPVSGPCDLRPGKAFGDLKLDDVLGGLATSAAAGRVLTSVSDPTGGCRLEMRADARFETCVVYNPPHREAVCIEPYTCVPDPFWLGEQGVAAGWAELAAGESTRLAVELELMAGA